MAERNPKGTDYDDLNRRLAVEEDGLPVAEVGPWTRHKLALLAYYLPAFAELCTQKSGGWYYIDGFAGMGVNRTAGFPLAKGTALIGVTQEPAPIHSILVERDTVAFHVLERRIDSLGAQATLMNGDANEVLPAALNQLPNRLLPAFCTLDPYGLELDWTTIEACAHHRLTTAGYLYELLIYFSTPGAARVGAVKAEVQAEQNAIRMHRLFGNDSWREIANDQQLGHLSAAAAGQRYLELYESQLKALGYLQPLHRAALHEERGLLYHLVFATGNDAGRNIMQWAIDRAYAGQLPLQM